MDITYDYNLDNWYTNNNKKNEDENGGCNLRKK